MVLWLLRCPPRYGLPISAGECRTCRFQPPREVVSGPPIVNAAGRLNRGTAPRGAGPDRASRTSPPANLPPWWPRQTGQRRSGTLVSSALSPPTACPDPESVYPAVTRLSTHLLRSLITVLRLPGSCRASVPGPYLVPRSEPALPCGDPSSISSHFQSCFFPSLHHFPLPPPPPPLLAPDPRLF